MHWGIVKKKEDKAKLIIKSNDEITSVFGVVVKKSKKIILKQLIGGQFTGSKFEVLNTSINNIKICEGIIYLYIDKVDLIEK
jgi:nitrogen regulatory protein PII-like uncharacterized protein